MMLQILFWLFLAATAVQLFFWLGIFSKIAFYKPSEEKNKAQVPISLIICARNEAENLSKNLHHFLTQNYRSFEIIVINDHSSDKTRDVVLNFQSKYTNLRLIENQALLPGKKAALTEGINAAKFEIIAVSDADCRPASTKWLATMQNAMKGNTQIVLGYSPYYVENNFLNRFIRFETVYTAIQYFSFALAGVPYMGVGRNLMYRKSLFQQERGFHKHTHIASGDDDLFVNATANNSNTNIVLNPKTFVFSQPKRSWRGYYNQKSRHLTTATSYKAVHQLALGALAMSHAGHYVLALVLLVNGKMILAVLLISLVRIGVVSWTYSRTLQKLQDPALTKWAPLLDALYVFYYFIFAPIIIIGRKDQWK